MCSIAQSKREYITGEDYAHSYRYIILVTRPDLGLDDPAYVDLVPYK